MNYDVIVLGSGPGGYVTAIRASQLGMKTAVIEKESLGGVCLNWGCIPTKALLKSANVYEYINHAEDYGIKVSSHKADFSAVVKRSRSVAEKMSGGVQFLMKKNWLVKHTFRHSDQSAVSISSILLVGPAIPALFIRQSRPPNLFNAFEQND